ncbi:hypothetical protein FJV76_23405 [Mesorhizobium sp. WSM4303]|uniref:hypothetical protein n=1 Tax=unclassified Mesorhizobium TaxID=325217 RepID=UPI00115DF0EB|nr:MULTISPECIES: hypothetical protein [unclassified Mesorhizobium]TRD00097.1 hypothetical protein FJV76_23405 [Mesorhizobium sp. WSM4303]TRD00339.1 hypothetical protein FJV77_00365 [Mesorhizobium sp. WSM4306]
MAARSMLAGGRKLGVEILDRFRGARITGRESKRSRPRFPLNGRSSTLLPLKLLTEVLPIVAKRPLLEWFWCAMAASRTQRKPLVNLNVPDP